MLEAVNLKCEYLENPVGLDTNNPRISWQIQGVGRGILQKAYQLQVAAEGDFSCVMWDTGKIDSEQSINVEIKELALIPRTRYYFRIRIWDNKGRESSWSSPSFWETGMLHFSEWKAEWVGVSTRVKSSPPEEASLFRRTFDILGKVNTARIYASALGLYELELNGKRVGDSYFTPGWTAYEKRVQYQVYEVDHLIGQGKNAIGIVLGRGWYQQDIPWANNQSTQKKPFAAILELHVQYEDGREEIIKTNEDWKCASGPIRMSELYHGETYDARLESLDWSTGGYKDTGWENAIIVPYKKDILVHQQNEPIRKIEELKPIALITTPRGERVLDMGQNMVGWIRFSITGYSGKQITLQHAEVLDGDGNFYIGNLRAAKQTTTYICKGDPNGETFEPHFSFQGFRYVKLEGYDDISLDSFTGIVLHSDMEQTGSFRCSNTKINQLQHNIEWGLKGNFLDVPTDCPQRDERLGWTGDAQMFIRTAAYLRNVAPFFTKWLKDLQAEQLEDGGIPFVIPDVLSNKVQNTGFNLNNDHSSSAWGDAAVICPWVIYLSYGDKRILEEQYESMKAWVEYIRHQGESEFLWNSGFHFGDWLALDSKPDSYVGATDKDFIATAFYGYSTLLLAKTAEVIGNKSDADIYQKLYGKIVCAFQNEFVTPSGRLAVQTQTAHVLVLMFDLASGKTKERIVQRLAELIKEANYHLTTGFVGTPYLNIVLSENGLHDLACKLLLQTDYPSWLYQVTKGATTIWEHWDGIKEDGSFWSEEMNSFNHYAYGSIGEWLYRVIAGINLDETQPGYKHIHIHPKPGADLEWIEAKLQTIYGEIASSWRLEGDRMDVSVTIPPNTTATVTLPFSANLDIDEIVKDAPHSDGVLDVTQTDHGVSLFLGSGNYQFSYHIYDVTVSMI
jgi:alpha-L-rhamnosidase